MINIIIALNAGKGRDKLSNTIAVGGNYNILPPVLSGAEVLQTVRRFGSRGVIICSEMLSDMHYTHLANLLPDNYKMLLIKQSGGTFYENEGNLAMLILPFTASELMVTIQTLSIDLLPKRPETRTKRAILEEAKAILMNRNKMTEPQAHRFIQKRSMDTRTDINTVSEEIIRIARESN